jgi:hypothetical protein
MLLKKKKRLATCQKGPRRTAVSVMNFCSPVVSHLSASRRRPFKFFPSLVEVAPPSIIAFAYLSRDSPVLGKISSDPGRADFFQEKNLDIE